jgi:hypothetical protein
MLFMVMAVGCPSAERRIERCSMAHCWVAINAGRAAHAVCPFAAFLQASPLTSSA